MNRQLAIFSMRKSLMLLATAALLLGSCQSKRSTVWDDNQMSGRLLNDELRDLWNMDQTAMDTEAQIETDELENSFVSLHDEDLRLQLADGAMPQSLLVPGDFASGILSLDQFSEPRGEMASLFRTIHFNTDDHILRDKLEIQAVERMAAFLKSNPKTYLFLGGHCDERGPEAYNLSLGSRRANYIRTLLIKQGADPDQLHTISYGKEQPAASGHNAESWAKNRRVEFKIYHRS